jgi:hypothetical protein
VLRGTLAAAITPLRDGGAALDEDAFAPYVDFLVDGELDGMLALGTTGEGLGAADFAKMSIQRTRTQRLQFICEETLHHERLNCDMEQLKIIK